MLQVPLPKASAARNGSFLRRGRCFGSSPRGCRVNSGDRDRETHLEQRRPFGGKVAHLRRARHDVRGAQDKEESKVPSLLARAGKNQTHRLSRVLRYSPGARKCCRYTNRVKRRNQVRKESSSS